MKLFYMVVLSLLVGGCAAIKKGDYVTYTSNEYVFVENNFIDKSIDCVELGEMNQGGLKVRYCVGENYASALVQGFIFEHDYSSFDERFIGSTLTFKAKGVITFQCSSETKDDAPSGKEYINCMIPKSSFDLHAFIVNSESDFLGQFKAALGEQKVYYVELDSKSKSLLKKFFKEREENRREAWKKRNL